MARQNFSHEKRQREIARKKKQEEKLARKLERKTTPDGETPVEPQPEPEPTA